MCDCDWLVFLLGLLYIMCNGTLASNTTCWPNLFPMQVYSNWQYLHDWHLCDMRISRVNRKTIGHCRNNELNGVLGRVIVQFNANTKHFIWLFLKKTYDLWATQGVNLCSSVIRTLHTQQTAPVFFPANFSKWSLNFQVGSDCDDIYVVLPSVPNMSPYASQCVRRILFYVRFSQN